MDLQAACFIRLGGDMFDPGIDGPEGKFKWGLRCFIAKIDGSVGEAEVRDKKGFGGVGVLVFFPDLLFRRGRWCSTLCRGGGFRGRHQVEQV